jgi:hypothetical protein
LTQRYSPNASDAPASAAPQGIGVHFDTPAALPGLPWGGPPEPSTEELGIFDAPRREDANRIGCEPGRGCLQRNRRLAVTQRSTGAAL